MKLFKRFRKQEKSEVGDTSKQTDSNEQKEEVQSNENQLRIGEIIYPAIKRADDSRILLSKQGGDPIVTKDFCDGLVVVYSLDLGSRFEMVSSELLKKHNATIEDLDIAAMRNLRKKVASVKMLNIDPPDNIEGGKSFTRILLDNNFDPSLMLIEELWPQFSELVQDKVIGVSIPAKNILAISKFSDDNIAFRTMRLFANHMYSVSTKDGIQLTDDSYIWKNGRWIKFLNTEEQFLELVN